METFDSSWECLGRNNHENTLVTASLHGRKAQQPKAPVAHYMLDSTKKRGCLTGELWVTLVIHGSLFAGSQSVDQKCISRVIVV